MSGLWKPFCPHWRLPLALTVLVCALASVPFSGASAQRGGPSPGRNRRGEDGPTVRVGTELVNVHFSVTDKQNRYINDVTQREVKVLENGKPQEIFIFKRESDLPLTMAVLVDISNSVLPVIPQLSAAAARFVNSVMRPGKDTAAVVQFDSEATLVQPLTASATRLHAGLREVARTASAPGAVIGGTAPPVPTGSRLGGTSIYDSVVATSGELLAGEAGRKTIILFTDGYDTTSRTGREEAVAEALRAEVVLYAIGIGDPSDEGVDKWGLNRLCEPTGGRAFFPKDVEDLDRAFAQLEQELRRQYLLAYEPVNEAADGRFRKIEVRVEKRKGLRVRHRRGYYALKP